MAHLMNYAILAAFLYHAMSGGEEPRWRPRRAFACVLLAALYSLTDEYHQIFVPGRTPTVVDSGIDTTGALLGMVIVYLDDRFSALLRSRRET
jgi:VanZ family protein